MDRQIAHLILQDRKGLLDHGVAFVLIGLAADGGGQFIHPLVAVIADVEKTLLVFHVLANQ
mgnify:CR=1 FL=1